MENIDKDKIDCKKEKEQFFSVLVKICIATFVITITSFMIIQTQKDKEKLIETFKMGKDLICSSKVVSLKNGYLFDEKNQTVSEGINIFRIENCRIKDL